MKSSIAKVFILLSFSGSSLCVNCQNAPIPTSHKQKLIGKTTAQIEDAKWIAGSWEGEAFGGTAEEIWSAPANGAMMGMFRLLDGGDISFYEIMVIRETDKSLILQLKHFHNDLKGWEEKDETKDFQLISISDDKVAFEGLYFQRINENEMKVNVIIDESKPEGVDFKYYRQ